MTGPRISHYDWPGGREAMLRFGPDSGPTVVAALPLFEEANRTRAAMVDVLRRLATKGIGGALPDLPGTGESLVATEDATLANWREAFAAAARTLFGPVHVIAWRGAALIDGEAEVASRWYLSPVAGEDVVRELRRMKNTGTADYAGNPISDMMLGELTSPAPVRPELVEGLSFFAQRKDKASTAPDQVRGRTEPVRTVRLHTDPHPADARLPGKPLWRASEPAVDEILQATIADDIAAWIVNCAA